MFSNTFICANDQVCNYDNHVAAPLFRRSFMMENISEKVYFTICGLGFYELYLNGERVTNGEIAPYVNNPDDILFYDKYDFTDKLKIGENVIGIMLGNGFFNEFGGFMWGFDNPPWKGPLRVAFSLEVGTKVIFEADENVKVSSSPVTFDGLRVGAFYDARLEQEGWNDVGFDDSDWGNACFISAPQGESRLRKADPIVIYGERKPLSIKHYDDFCFCCKSNAVYADEFEETRVKDTYVYDFGVNDSGVCRLKIKGEAGQKITLRFGEMMVDGKFSLRSTIFVRDTEDTTRYLQYQQMDQYICKSDGEEIFIPPFTYHGFRYVLVEGIKKEQATNDLLTYLVMGSDLKERADFSCSDETLNELFKMARRSDRSNFFFFPNDCPHREKNGWTGDASLSAEHMLLHSTATNSLKEWMHCVRKAQRSDGAFPGIVPTAGWGFEWGNGPIWDSVCVSIPYYCYKFDGDTQVIKENKEAILKYLRYAYGKRDSNGLVAFGLNDWCQPHFVNSKFLSPLEFTDSAMLLDITKKAAYLFSVVGDNENADYALGLAKEMRNAIRNNLIDFKTMIVAGHCQTSQAVAIAMDIFEENEKAKALEVLIEIIKMTYDHINTGIFGGRYIFHVLVDNGYADLAYKMIARTDSPSYGAWLAAGGTTLWEHFHPDDVHRASQNHHMWGDILSLFIQRFAGLMPNPYVRDINEFVVAPVFVSALSWVHASYEHINGRVEVKWEKEGATVRMQVVVPDGCYGSICLPPNFAFSDGSSKKALTSATFYISYK